MADTETNSRSTVVDDTEDVVRVVTTILKASGYRVLSANDGASAGKLASNYTGPINLLLSDIEMPDMTGPQLGNKIKEPRPDMHVNGSSSLCGLHRGAVLHLQNDRNVSYQQRRRHSGYERC
jgi:DNA-binding NtrC family response regulator